MLVQLDKNELHLDVNYDFRFIVNMEWTHRYRYQTLFWLMDRLLVVVQKELEPIFLIDTI